MALEGFQYRPHLISMPEEMALLAHLRELPFTEFDFHGYKGKRRIVSFGWQYEFSGPGTLRKADDIPEFLLRLRSLAASFAKLDPEELQHVLVTEYRPGAGIGWHRDKHVFGEVVGVSLLAPCVLRFRRKLKDKTSAVHARIGDAVARDSDPLLGASSLVHQRAKIRSTWERTSILAEPRSAYLLSGPARFEWEHSILRVNALRYSITFRNVRAQ